MQSFKRLTDTRNIFPIRSTVPEKFVVIFSVLIPGAFLMVTLGIICSFFIPARSWSAAVDMGPSECYSCRNDAPSNNSGGSGNSGYDYDAAVRAQEAAEAAAIAEQQRQAEEARIERERLAEEKQKKAAAAAAFISGRDAAASTLKGSSDPAMSQFKGLSDAVNSGLKGSSFDTGSQLKPEPASSSGDPMVVDARKVSPGLMKNVNNAIAAAYSDAPPGVSDRVRKGFQAVAERDWKVAKAWFQDALNRDPDNAGLKRLVALIDPPKHTAPAAGMQLQLPDPNDIYIFFPRPKDQTAPAVGTQLQLPDEKDILLLFPGEYPTTPAGTQLQLPDEKDMYLTFPGLEALDEKEAQDLLFGLDAQPPALKSQKTK